MATAGTQGDLEELFILSSVPKLLSAIDQLNQNFIRFATIAETRAAELKTLVEEGSASSIRTADAVESMEAELKAMGRGVVRIVHVAQKLVASHGLDLPWAEEKPPPPPERKPTEEMALAELAECYLAHLDRDSRGLP